MQECADLIGPSRNFYTTADTVADLEALRAALRVPRWALDGVSYGSFVGARYGLADPRRVSRLVLDSVVPHTGAPALYPEGLARVAYVLRAACKEQSCGYDPAQELADVVRRHGNGVGIFDLLVTASIVDPKLTGAELLPGARCSCTRRRRATPAAQRRRSTTCRPPGPRRRAVQRRAARGDALRRLRTTCRGEPPAPLAGRRPPWTKVSRIPALGIPGRSPRRPPATRASSRPAPLAAGPPEPGRRPARLVMPVLLLAGDRDLSTPLPWAQEQARLTPRASSWSCPAWATRSRAATPGDASRCGGSCSGLTGVAWARAARRRRGHDAGHPGLLRPPAGRGATALAGPGRRGAVARRRDLVGRTGPGPGLSGCCCATPNEATAIGAVLAPLLAMLDALGPTAPDSRHLAHPRWRETAMAAARARRLLARGLAAPHTGPMGEQARVPRRRLVELSHVVRDGHVDLPGRPGPVVTRVSQP